MYSDFVTEAVRSAVIPMCKGTVAAAGAQWVEAVLPGARVGSRVFVVPAEGEAVPAEAASVDRERVRLHLLRASSGVRPGDEVRSDPSDGRVRCGPGVLGRVLDALGAPMDAAGPVEAVSLVPFEQAPPPPLSRRPVDRRLITGIRVIDGCMTLGYGQRVGLFAGPGLGKSTLLSLLARRAEVDVSVVCLVGERGREINEFIHDALGPEAMKRATVIAATADAPPMARVRSLDTATAVAEWFRARGLRVLLLVDSLTRVVRAKREAAFAMGEPPSRGGFPASAFSFLPGVIERTGCDAHGSITAIYAVLTEGDGADPIAEEARSLLDGHIVLSEKRARSGRWPAVDLLASVSRVFEKTASPEAVRAAVRLKRMESAYLENEDLILMGAYRRGTSPDTDAALDKRAAVEDFLCQHRDERSSMDETLKALLQLSGD